MQDRRVQRSENRAEALQIYLASVARRTGAQSVVLADGDGLLVGGHGADLEWIAANTVAPANDAEVSELVAGGTTLRVAAVGAPLPTPEVHAAVVRILDL